MKTLLISMMIFVGACAPQLHDDANHVGDAEHNEPECTYSNGCKTVRVVNLEDCRKSSWTGPYYCTIHLSDSTNFYGLSRKIGTTVRKCNGEVVE